MNGIAGHATSAGELVSVGETHTLDDCQCSVLSFMNVHIIYTISLGTCRCRDRMGRIEIKGQRRQNEGEKK